MMRLIALALLLSPASIFSDVAGFLTNPGKTIKDLAGKVWGAIKHTISYFSGILRGLAGAWTDLHGAFRTLIGGLEHLAEGTYSAIRWLSNTIVPKGIKHAIAEAVGWAERNVKSVIKRIDNAASTLRSLISRTVNTAKAALGKLIKAAKTVADKGWNWVSNRGNKIWDIVMHPAKMVAWILPSLVTPLLRFLRDHLEAVSAQVLRYFFSNPAKYALQLEKVIRDIL